MPPTSGAGEKVRDFYERMPYPPPLERLPESHDPEQDASRRRALFHRMWPAARQQERQHILIADCGTSQAARYALRAPDAHVTAIDVSETSLRHTRALQRRHDLGNLHARRLRIEEVSALGETFDLIVCTGVLHHLPDPDVGLRALRDVLRPQGAMQLMVYAQYGRAGIYMIREYCRLLRIGSSERDLRELGAALDVLSSDHAIANVLRHAMDFRSPDAMADALLNPVDRAYTVPELYAWLERCGMSFGRWVEQAPYLPQCGLLARSPHAARLAALPEREQHSAVELFRGTMVSHSVIAYRADHPGEPQPISFTDHRWLGFVPIALPWTVRVTERRPPDSVAVLINRAHTFTDLVLTVDGFEDRVLRAIDGARTVGEILRDVVSDEHGERRALDFLERLWRYDQIVFDAISARGSRSSAS